MSLCRIVEYYNFVREKTEKCEFDIISGQIEMIEADLKILLENFTWIKFGKLFFVSVYIFSPFIRSLISQLN